MINFITILCTIIQCLENFFTRMLKLTKIYSKVFFKQLYTVTCLHSSQILLLINDLNELCQLNKSNFAILPILTIMSSEIYKKVENEIE